MEQVTGEIYEEEYLVEPDLEPEEEEYTEEDFEEE